MGKKAKSSDKLINWIDLPINCKQNIVGNLDFIDRTLLSHCSKSDLELVKNTSFFIKELRLEQITELKYRILLPGCLEVTIEDPHRHRNLRNKRVFHDYVMFTRKRIVRKSDRSGFSTIFSDIIDQFLENENFIIETLCLDDTFFTGTQVSIPCVGAKIENLKIQKAQTSPGNWIDNNRCRRLIFMEMWCLKMFLQNLKHPHHLKSLIMDHGNDCRAKIRCEYPYHEYLEDEAGYDEDVNPIKRNPMLFDEQFIQNLAILVLPARQNIYPCHLALLKARKLVIWSDYLDINAFCSLLKRWDSEDVPVGSSVRIEVAEPDLKKIEQFKGFEILETKENQMMIRMSSEKKKFRVFIEKPREICCEVVDF